MAQKSLTVNVAIIKPFKENMFEDFLSIDSDFFENEEYYRKDTLDLGFRSEAHRISAEYTKEFKKDWGKLEEERSDEVFEELINEYLEKLANVYAGDNQFILGNDTYVSDYVITAISDFSDYDAEITVVISYIG